MLVIEEVGVPFKKPVTIRKNLYIYIYIERERERKMAVEYMQLIEVVGVPFKNSVIR